MGVKRLKIFKGVMAVLLTYLFCFSNAFAADLIHFWDIPRHGANVFDRMPANSTLYPALAKYRFSWVRFAYDKWHSKHKDFLIGDVSHFNQLVANDLKLLKKEINKAGQAGLKVVIAPLSLPLSRATQLNNYVYDGRIWLSKANWQPSIEFWKQLATELKDNPYVAAYNIVNEPTPEKMAGLNEHATKKQQQGWYRSHQGTSRDLLAYYTAVVSAIRKIDPDTPIMLDAGWYAAADDFSYWPKALPYGKILYSYHMYEPYAFTSVSNYRRKKPYRYPGVIPFADTKQYYWGQSQITQYLEQPIIWATKVGIPINRLIASEFGCVRKLHSCQSYLNDVASTLSHQSVSWAFYGFREDDWDEMNYELGKTINVPESFWQRIADGLPDNLHYHCSALFGTLLKYSQ